MLSFHCNSVKHTGIVLLAVNLISNIFKSSRQ